jgi:hypothetical protein
MTQVIKKNKQSSVQDLRKALLKLMELLEGQDELEAVEDLKRAMLDLQEGGEQSPQFKQALALINEAFEGDHNLSAYTLPRKNREGQWGEVEELYLASTGVLNLVRRLSQAH